LEHFDFDASPVSAAVRDRLVEKAPSCGQWPDASRANYDRYRQQWLRVLHESGLFGPATARSIRRRMSHGRDWFMGWLTTLSWYKVLDADAKAALQAELCSLDLDTLALDMNTLLIVAERAS
jgi:hypothetical protein